MKKCIKGIWIVLGLTQTILAGCNGPAQAQAEQPLSRSAGQNEANSRHAATIDSSQQPVRISRAFFERSVVGTVRIDQDEVQSNVQWTVYPPTAPVPTEPVLADFRDRVGCASYENTNGVQLCFRVMPDVSSIGFNELDVRPEGLCGGQFQNARFVTAKRADGSVSVTFQGECQGQAKTAEFTLRQI